MKRSSSDWSTKDKVQMDIKEGQEEETSKTKLIQEIQGRLGKGRPVQDAEEYSSIYKVPSKIRKALEDAYNPRIVSIGPFHRKNPDLAAMKDHKWFYMRSFLQRTGDSVEPCTNATYGLDEKVQQTDHVEHCLNALYRLDEKVRQCYAECIEYDNTELAKMMLLDGCFILELFLRYYHAKTMGIEDRQDPILKSAWMIAALQHDLALLENQMPFFILKHLYDIVKPRVIINGCVHPVAGLALTFFQPLSRKPLPKEDELGINFKHLLDLLRNFYFLSVSAGSVPNEVSITVKSNIMGLISNIKIPQPSCPLFSKVLTRRKPTTASCCPEPDDTINNRWGFNFCASELLESGIQFQLGSWDENLLQIRFNKGVISIPQLIIDEATSSVFRNLIAFEQCSLSSTHSVTSYAFLMKSLIRSSADTKILREINIIRHNRIGDHEYLSKFKNILDEVVVKDDFEFGALRDQVNMYCTSWCSLSKLQVFLRMRVLREIRLLSSTYFSSTWSFISFVAALALLILAFLQTYYTIDQRRR